MAPLLKSLVSAASVLLAEPAPPRRRLPTLLSRMAVGAAAVVLTMAGCVWLMIGVYLGLASAIGPAGACAIAGGATAALGVGVFLIALRWTTIAPHPKQKDG